MGILDAQFPSAGNLIERAQQHSNTIGLLGVAAGVTGVSVTTGAGTPLLSVVAPVAAQLYLESSAKQLTRFANERFSHVHTKARTDADINTKDAVLIRACSSLTSLLDPLVPDDAEYENARQLAREEPEEFQQMIATAFENDAEALQEVEHKLQQLFHVEPSDTPGQEAIEEVKQLFDIDSDQETIQFFRLFRMLFAELYDELNDIEGEGHVSEDVLNELDRVVHQMDEAIEELLDTLLKIELEDRQGFQQLDVGYYHSHTPYRENESPFESWVWGLKLRHLAAKTTDGEPYQFNIQTSADEQPFYKSTQQMLEDGEGPIVVTAGPECGKSTICKRVAYEWINEDAGIVFYRGSGSPEPFDGAQTLLTSIKQAQSIAGGTPLVVVEDAPRKANQRILDVIDRCLHQENLDVAFLLDARESEWEQFHSRHPEYNALLDSTNGAITQRELPEISEVTCENAIRAFNRISGGKYRRLSPSQLHDYLESNTPSSERAFEMTTLISELIEHGTSGVIETPATASVREVFRTFIETPELDTAAARRRARLTLCVNLLNAAELNLHPELVFAVAFAEADSTDRIKLVNALSHIETLLLSRYTTDNDTTVGDVEGLQNAVVRVAVGESDKLKRDVIDARPPSWSCEFLRVASESDQQRVVQELLSESLTAVLSLGGTNEGQIALLERWFERPSSVSRFQRTEYLDQLRENPVETTETVATRVYEWASQETTADGWSRTLLEYDYDPLFDSIPPTSEALHNSRDDVLPYKLRRLVLPTTSEIEVGVKEFDSLIETLTEDPELSKHVIELERAWTRLAQARFLNGEVGYDRVIETYKRCINEFSAIDVSALNQAEMLTDLHTGYRSCALEFLGLFRTRLPEAATITTIAPESSPLRKTTTELRYLRIASLRATRTTPTTVEVELSVRFKPIHSDEKKTDMWGYAESGLEPALKTSTEDPTYAAFLERMLPLVVEQPAGYAKFRESATKTITPIERLLGVELPRNSELPDTLCQHISNEVSPPETADSEATPEHLLFRIFELSDEEIQKLREAHQTH